MLKDQKNGEKFRKDGFFEETPTNHSNFEEVVESTLKKVMDTTEAPKIKFMANLTENVHFNENLDMDTYRQILKDLDELTYRQLCIIRLIILCRNQEVDMDSIPISEEQIPQNEQITFYAIGGEYQRLMDEHYIMSTPIPRSSETHDPLLRHPGNGWLPDSTERLASFVKLSEIPDQDIFETFSLWNVRPRE